ncbi:MAG: hypothetical protein FWH01_09760 [Oscillospiraceae bacterium]|nr:hypothetical protein [Oscillospiraceae bacterium]
MLPIATGWTINYATILAGNRNDCGTGLLQNALSSHGIDNGDINVIPNILVEGYHENSRYFKIFRDHLFRASEYQMSLLMFGASQLYSYSYTFDLTSADTVEQTKEYFYKDITSISVTKKGIEYPNPRPLGYLIGGLAVFVFGIIIGLVSLAQNEFASVIFSLIVIIAGFLLMVVFGYSRSLAHYMVIKLTVPEDTFECVMNIENMVRINEMKSLIRDKKLNY